MDESLIEQCHTEVEDQYGSPSLVIVYYKIITYAQTLVNFFTSLSPE